MLRATREERYEYANEMMDEILDSADFPLDVKIAFIIKGWFDLFNNLLMLLCSKGRGWWRSAEDPLQCLAACKEIASATRSGNCENFVSHLPVHQVWLS